MTSSKKVVPEAMDSLEKFKYEVANEVGVNLKNGYNGNIREYRDGYLLIDGVSNYNKISVGDKVYTSGLGVLDKGLFIGNVSDILEDSYGIDNILYVTVPSFENISYVMVLAHD